jgi:hypothetical protein
MKMPSQNLFIFGFFHPFSWEILWTIKKLTELLRQEGVSPPPCPTPIKISFGQGLPKSD